VSADEIAPPPQAPAKPQVAAEDLKALPRAAVDLLFRFHIVIKNSRIYEANNELFREQTAALFGAIQSFLDRMNEAVIQVRMSALFFNGVRLKFVLATYPIFKFVLEEFKSREISTISFLPGLTQEELVRFIGAFGMREKRDGMSYQTLVSALEEADIEHVAV
jgi:hypothetical protein